MSHTVYIVKCRDKTLYTGTAQNVMERLRAHNTTKAGAKYTRSRRPVKLVYAEVLRNISLARKREAAIKCLTRKEKMALIALTPKVADFPAVPARLATRSVAGRRTR